MTCAPACLSDSSWSCLRLMGLEPLTFAVMQDLSSLYLEVGLCGLQVKGGGICDSGLEQGDGESHGDKTAPFRVGW